MIYFPVFGGSAIYLFWKLWFVKLPPSPATLSLQKFSVDASLKFSRICGETQTARIISDLFFL